MRIQVLILVLFLSQTVRAWPQAKTLQETHNAALRYWQAFAELKDPPPDKEIQAEIQTTLLGATEWNEAKLGSIVAENEVALGIMQRATKLPDCDWGIEYSQGAEASVALVPRAHVLARLNTLRGVRELAQRHPQAAVDTWIAGIRFDEDVAKGGSLLFALTARDILLSEMRVVTAEARKGRLNAAQKKQLYTAFSALPEDGFDWGEAWELDEAGTDLFFAEVQHSQKPASVYERLMGQAAPKDCVPPSGQQVKVYHDYMNDVASALRLPSAAAKDRLAALVPEKNRICEAIQIAIPSPERVNDERAEVIQARKDLLSALAR